ncbi:MAG: proline dehydrogenase family protein [Phycisphaerales bacterium]|nr:MAG: proline dehydrogenase family protein [Phycisphaerales bacterium]
MSIFSRKPKPAPVPARPAAPPPPSDSPRILELGTEMLRRARGHKTSVLSAKFYSDALMEWSMKDHEFKVQMFRFVDAFPMLKTPDAVFDHLQDYLSQPGVIVPAPIAAALKMGGVAKGIAAKTIAGQVEGMAGKFIAGVDAASALPRLTQLWNDGIAFSVDLLGEVCVSDEEADMYQRKYLDLIENLPGKVSAWRGQPRLESDHLGPIPRTNVSVKISALSARVDPIDTEGSIKDLMRRLVPILESAKAKGVFVNFDMEHFALKDLTLSLFERCVEAVDFHGGLAMQAYLRSGPDDARRICQWAKAKGKQVTVRLVKGAYWDAETIKAELHGWACPVWSKKSHTDACFEEMTRIFLDHTPRAKGEAGVKLALGSHNVRSIAAALTACEERSLPHSAIELQMLHGMADQLKYAAEEMGLRMREYVPVGEMIPGMAYLVRRLLENTSNESWLKAGFLDNADPATLLTPPAAPRPGEIDPADSRLDPSRHTLSPSAPNIGDGKPFLNEPMRDFAHAKVRDTFAKTVENARVPQVANDVTPDKARMMVEAAHAAFPGWRDTPHALRAEVLVRAAAAMRARRDELSGIMIKEAGKTWREADADTCEAIDFCEYYARCSVPLFTRERLGRFIGELDEQWYQPRGVAVVIAPWNFPLAICCGMTVAALVTGNTVIVKPAEQTPGIASVLFSILQDALKAAGAPANVLHFCPGPGETTGAALVRDPRVALIAFTGSRDVGLDILHAAAPATPFDSGTRADALALTHVKRVVCEMGGKNALIIDTSADLDEAVLAVRQSAFGFQGQKCSACSRCIVVDPQGTTGLAFTHFVHRLVEATKALVIADPLRPGTDVGPVIDADAKSKIMGFIERTRASGLTTMSLDMPGTLEGETRRHFVPPTIVYPVPESHELAREEVFGPVLAVMHASTYDDALRIANSAAYKLTGGVFSRKPAHLEKAKREFRVGNLYLNRGITGALVARHPFGGFGMSGVGSKAGGKDYLLQFVEPRASAENTLRRGFAPEL